MICQKSKRIQKPIRKWRIFHRSVKWYLKLSRINKVKYIKIVIVTKRNLMGHQSRAKLVQRSKFNQWLPVALYHQTKKIWRRLRIKVVGPGIPRQPQHLVLGSLRVKTLIHQFLSLLSQLQKEDGAHLALQKIVEANLGKKGLLRGSLRGQLNSRMIYS